MIEPQKVKTSGLCQDLRKQFNAALDVIKSLRPLEGHATQIDKTAHGFYSRPKSSSSSNQTTGGARWL